MSRILVIDDSSLVLHFVEGVLRPAGYRVDTVPRASEGIGRYAREPYDLVILDLVMPDIDGIEAILSLMRLDPSVKILAISSRSKDFLRMAQKIGAIATLTKPFKEDRLLEVVSRLLGKSAPPDPRGT